MHNKLLFKTIVKNFDQIICIVDLVPLQILKMLHNYVIFYKVLNFIYLTIITGNTKSLKLPTYF